MATEMEQMAAQPAPAAPPKHENFVEQELAKVRGRIRSLDAGGFFLLFLIATLGYALVLVLVDRAFELSTAARFGTFLLYLGVSVYLLVQCGLCFWRRVNQYYAARQIVLSVAVVCNGIVNTVVFRD